MGARCYHGRRIEVFADLASQGSIYGRERREGGGEPVCRVREVRGVVFRTFWVHYEEQLAACSTFKVDYGQSAVFVQIEVDDGESRKVRRDWITSSKVTELADLEYLTLDNHTTAR
jgi:hypothetical protein